MTWHAELERWTDREKLLQLELHLTNKAEQVYEVLPEEVKATSDKAVESLKKRLRPVRNEALLSVQLMKRRQRTTESVDEHAQDFEAFFDKSYGKRVGMDEESKQLLKGDFFVQGLLLKWQEVLPSSAAMFADALYKASTVEEQDKQLTQMHHPSKTTFTKTGSMPPPATTSATPATESPGRSTTTPTAENHGQPCHAMLPVW